MIVDFNVGKLITDYVTPERVSMLIKVALILLIGIPLVRFLRTITRKILKDRLSPQGEQLVVRSVYYISVIILLMTVLNEFGFKLSALLGAAGVFGIAIGFASQTSVSNIISGIFLISEKPFVIGDMVQIGTTTGTVESIDLLSIKLKTADNRFVRVPNETMIKTEVINITRYPIRRANINVSVSYRESLPRVLGILKAMADEEPMVLKEPEPLVMVESFGESGINILYGVWGKQDEILQLKTTMMLKIKDRFDKDNIEIPYPHLTLIGSEKQD